MKGIFSFFLTWTGGCVAGSIVICLVFGACMDRGERPSDIRWAGRVIVPKNIIWQPLDPNNTVPECRYAKYRTYYFADDHTAYAVDCINYETMACVDTSIYDKREKVYHDTAVCHYEDSILFAVENIELYKGAYRAGTRGVVCRLKGFNGAITDTIISVGRGNEINFYVRGELYIPASTFKKESYRRLNDLVEAADAIKLGK